MSNMYREIKNGVIRYTKTWNPAVGCKFDCVYCEKSFKKQLKRVGRSPEVFQGNLNPFEPSRDIKGGCTFCSTYEPHYHSERLDKIPSALTVFVFGTGDISFYDPSFVRKTFKVIDNHRSRMKKTYYFQSKNPVCFNQYLPWFNENTDKVILLTTLETNRNKGYRNISKAPLPSIRFYDFLDVEYSRKAVTTEPVLPFDIEIMATWMLLLRDQGTLEYVWYGYDSKNCGLPEVPIAKSQSYVDLLQKEGIEVRGKTLKGVHLNGGQEK